MRFGTHVVSRLGYAPAFGKEVIWMPVLVAGGLTAANLGMAQLKWIEYGYFSPYVAAVAIVSARVCIRAGLSAALMSILCWNLLVVPPFLEFTMPTMAEATAYAAAIVAAIWTAPRRKIAIEDRSLGREGDLPFVKKRSNGMNGGSEACCWDVAPSGDWEDDDMVGAQYGRIMVHRVQSHAYGTPPLSMVLQDMIKKGEFTGVEAGFASAIERAVASGDEPPATVDVGVLLAEYYANYGRLERRI